MARSLWPLLVAATCGVLAGHWIAMSGVLLGAGDAAAGYEWILVALGLAVLGTTVAAAAIASGRGVAAGMAAAAVGGVVMAAVWAVRSDEVPLPALVAGVGVGAVLAVRRRPVHLLWVRFVMVVVIFAYVLWVTHFSAAFAIIITPFLPFPTVGVADFASEREARRRLRPGYAAPE